MRFVRTLIPLSVILTLGVGVACKKPAPAPVAPVKPVEAPSTPAQADTDAQNKRAQEEEAARRKAEADAESAKAMAEAQKASALKAAMEAAPKEINFDFDKSEIREMDKNKLQALADFLKAHPQATLLIDGHCDERGTIEYNLALGERRASAAQSYLVGLGVSDTRMTTNSYGKERPKIKDRHDDEAMMLNRRDEFTLR